MTDGHYRVRYVGTDIERDVTVKSGVVSLNLWPAIRFDAGAWFKRVEVIPHD